MLLYPFTNMADASMINNITEWKSPNFHFLSGLNLFILISFPIFNLILNKNKMKLHEIAFQLLFLYMILRSQRFGEMYVIYSAWTIGKYCFISDDMYNLLKKPFIKYEKIITIIFCCLLVYIEVIIGYYQVNKFASSSIINNNGYYSDEAVKQIIKLKPKRLYNDYGSGGYLLYKLNEYNALDEVKIFAYGLGDVLSGDILPDSANLENTSKDTRKIIEKYDFDVLITSEKLNLHYFLDEMDEYTLYYSDVMCYIYIKVK